ncbi:peptidase S8 [bacterium]|nr:peptidase S8 [candidate division CSSED10-310 bacterium]
MTYRIGIILVVLLQVAVSPSLSADDFSKAFSSRTGEVDWRSSMDLNGDGIIDGYDLAVRSISGDDSAGLKGAARFRADRILVKFAQGTGLDQIRDLLDPMGVNTDRIKALTSIDYSVIPVPDNMTAERLLEIVKRMPSVDDAQFDYICYMTKTPNDELYNLQWNFGHVKAEEAWDLTSGGHSSVTVAVLDTGIAYENYGDFEQAPDLGGTAFKSAYDFINDDTHANDDEGHGTHVAGTIAQTTNNGMGVAGLAYKSTLIPVKILDQTGTGTSSSLAQGIRWAADRGANVINMSLGFPVGTDGGAIVRDAVTYAYGKSVIMVAASGNEAGDPGYSGGVAYPAAYDECIAVGAIRYDRRYTDYSNFGSKLTCVAPGGAIGLDQNNDGYADGILQQTFVNADPTKFRYVFYQGTSMATPHVAAAAALFVSRKGGGPAEFLQTLKDTCEDLGAAGFDQHYGYGLINLPGIIRGGQGWGAN